MKNLHKWRKKEVRFAVLCFGLVILPIFIMLSLNTFFKDFLQPSNTTIISIACMSVCWILALIVLGKQFQKMIIVDAMIKNEKRLRTDRRTYPSERTNVTAEKLGFLFEELSFEKKEDKNVFVKNNISFYIEENIENPAQYLEDLKNSVDEPFQRGKKPTLICVLFLCEKGTPEQEELSRDVLALNNGCILPVFYDIIKNTACFMGGFCGKRAYETSLQALVKNVILNHPEPYPEKTNEDKTEEEIEFDKLDLDVIFEEVSQASATDIATIEKMNDDEISLIINGKFGTLYYKKDGKGISHLFNVVSEKNIIIEPLELVYYCFPKPRPVKGQPLLDFKRIMEQYLLDHEYEYTYKNEAKL